MAESREAWSAVAAGISCVVAIVALVVAKKQVDIGNKQVAAGEQQVTVGKQQVDIGNKQVAAGEQQVTVGKQQVDIGKQQAATSEQQTRMAEAQHKAAQQQLRATAWSMIAQLDATLRQYDAERRWVKDQAEKLAEDQDASRDQHDITGYMGVFERLNELLDTNPPLVSERTAYTFYSSRLRGLLKTKRVRRILQQSPKGWASFISLSLKLDDYGRQNADPVITVQSSDPESRMEPDKAYRTKLEGFRAGP
jgi:hypothetical protein